MNAKTFTVLRHSAFWHTSLESSGRKTGVHGCNLQETGLSVHSVPSSLRISPCLSVSAVRFSHIIPADPETENKPIYSVKIC